MAPPVVAICTHSEQLRYGAWDAPGEVVGASLVRAAQAAGALVVLVPRDDELVADPRPVLDRVDGVVAEMRAEGADGSDGDGHAPRFPDAFGARAEREGTPVLWIAPVLPTRTAPSRPRRSSASLPACAADRRTGRMPRCASPPRPTTRSARRCSSPPPGDGPAKGDTIAQRPGHPAEVPGEHPLDLRHAGLVRSQRGAEGGYWLARARRPDHRRRRHPRRRRPAGHACAASAPRTSIRGRGRAAQPRSGSPCARTCARCVEHVTLADIAAGSCRRRSSARATTPRPGSRASGAQAAASVSVSRANRRAPFSCGVDDVAGRDLELARPRRG